MLAAARPLLVLPGPRPARNGASRSQRKSLDACGDGWPPGCSELATAVSVAGSAAWARVSTRRTRLLARAQGLDQAAPARAVASRP